MPQRSEVIAQTSLDEAAAAIDDAVHAVRRGTFVALEAINAIASHTAWFIHLSISTPDEDDLLLDYAHDSAVELAELVRDPVLVEFFEDQLESLRLGPELQAALENELEALESAIVAGDLEAAARLHELCQCGWRTNRVMLSVVGGPLLVLRTAARVRHVDALRDAVSPRYAARGQIAHPLESPDAYRFALNALAHLATEFESPRGDDARAALLDLVGHVDTAGDAAVRLPLHLLSGDDLELLVAAHEDRASLFENDPVFVPVGLEMLRANRVVRAALWQAHDAQHLA
ncbi:MAG: hypothetical protein GX868_12275 [Actinobacteria bacterium]|nr:hypothetical protein [Actinomycetota bacterium]